MTPLNATKESYTLTEIDGRFVLFTNMRLDRDTVPEGLFCYDVRDSDHLDGCMAEVRPFVMANHWGTILSKTQFPLDEHGSYCPKDWGYLDKSMSLAEFQAAMPEHFIAFQKPSLACPSMTMK